MPIDASIALQAKLPQIESPLSRMAAFSQLQALQNQNSLFPMQLQQMQLANQQKQQQFDMIKPILARMASGGTALTGDNPSAPGNSAGGQASSVLSKGNPQNIPTDDGIPYSLSDLGALATAGYPGAKEMLEVKKAAMQGVSFDPGKTYKIGDKVFTIPQLDKGMEMGNNGVEEIENFGNVNAAIQGKQARATENAKLLPLDYKTAGMDGRPIGGTVGEYLGSNIDNQASQNQKTLTPLSQLSGAGTSVANIKGNPRDMLARMAMSNDPNAADLMASYKRQLQNTQAGRPNLPAPSIDAQGSPIDATPLQSNAITPSSTNIGQSGSAVQGGYQVPAVAKDGSPIPPQTQQALSTIANSGDPQKVQQLIDQVMPHLNAIQDPAQKASALSNFGDEISNIQKYIQSKNPQGSQSTTVNQSLPQASASNQKTASVMSQQTAATPIATPVVQSTGRPALQSPAEAEAAKAQALADVKLNTEPVLKSATDIAGGNAKNFTDYKDGLNKAVDSGYSQYLRNQQVRQLLTEYQTGLSSPDLRSSFASNLKNAFPNSPNIKAFAEKVNGGNVGSGQELANLLSAAGLTNVIKVLDGNGRVNKAEYAALQEHAEKNTSDPDALLGIMGFQDNVYKQQLAEQQALSQAEKNKTLNPATWNADYAMIRHNQQTPSSLPPTPGQKNKTNIQSNARGWILHTDAKGNRAYVSPDGTQFEEVK